MSDEQAATDPNPAPTEPVQEPSEPSIDDLLAEFDSAQEEPVPQPASEPTPEPAPVDPDRLTALEARLDAADRRDTDTSNLETISSLGVEGLDNFDSQDVYDWMRIQAGRNPAIENAYTKRHDNPSGWKKVMERMGKDFVGKFVQPDPQLTADRDAVTQAVRGQTHVPSAPVKPTQQDMDKMTMRELLATASGTN